MKEFIKSTSRILRIAICFFIAIACFNQALELVSAADTLLNFIGVILLCVVVLITIKTKFFTTFKSHKNEKNN